MCTVGAQGVYILTYFDASNVFSAFARLPMSKYVKPNSIWAAGAV